VSSELSGGSHGGTGQGIPRPPTTPEGRARGEAEGLSPTARPPTPALRGALRSAGQGFPQGLIALAIPLALGWVGTWLTLPSIADAHRSGPLPALCSPWFVGSLATILIGWAVWSTRRLSWTGRLLVLGPGALVLGGLVPDLPSPWARAGYALAAGVVVVWLTFVLQYVYRHPQLEARTMRFLREATILAAVAGAGWFLVAFDGDPVVWALTGVGAAFVLARGVTTPTVAEPRQGSAWLLRPDWAVELLLAVFLTEFFLGALLDLEVAGRTFLQYIPFYPASGAPMQVVAVQAYNGLWFGAAILASAWFLVAIGVTMGGLVVLRLRELHVPAQRYRMGLMLGFYAGAAVYVPSLASSTPLLPDRLLANLPLVGWGFGLRSGGPFESGVFLAILIMYASVGVLTVLFGRKALCAVMCGAALMYQGTTTHAMRQYNQSSSVGRYFLGSRLSTAYVVASALALASLFAVSLLACLHRLPTVQVANGEYDTGALPLPVELYFGGLWFAMFVSTPYVGTYNCATTGICHWGSLSVPFARVGFYRLRARDRSVCERCRTFDCAKSCPVGLVDMPLHLRTTGEFRSTKCCGVGDCIGACPYGNLYDQDVRAWVLRALHRRPRPRSGTVLPMVPPGEGPATPVVPSLLGGPAGPR